ncbi:MAG TPA: hypothetical protein GXZ74_03405 [Tissierellia bacterium]|nr:hypothetical protein [Tissierellia bacterium]
MKRRAVAFLSLMLGLLLISGVVLFNSLSGGPRSITHLISDYGLYLLIGLGLIVGFILLSRKKT